MAVTLHTPLRDPARTFTPLGRPFRKPRKVVVSLSSLASGSNIDDFYFLERPRLRPKIRVGFRERTESRPSLQLPSEEGPSPCTYTLPPPPRCDLGGKINPRKKYDRDIPPRPNYEVWTFNTRSLEVAPSPCSYAVTNGLGGKSPSRKAGPAHSMGGRLPLISKAAVSKCPAPNHYNAARCSDYVSRHFPSFSMGAPDNQNKKKESSPGPAHYHPRHSVCQTHSPSFTIAGRSTAH